MPNNDAFEENSQNELKNICTNQQLPQRGGAVPNPVLGWIEMAIGFPEGPSYPRHFPSFFRYAAP